MQLGIVLIAAVAGVAAAVWQARQELDRQYMQRSLAIAQTVASMPSVQQAVLSADRSGTVQAMADSVRASSGATYVVVTDAAGIRYSHPNPELIGQRVSTEPDPLRTGQSWVGIQRGTLGVSARGKAPMLVDGRVVGMVSVGYLEEEVSRQLLRDLPGYAAMVAAVLVLATAGSLLLAGHLKRQTFGLEPYEIAGLLEEREASLQRIREGALATDREGRITLINHEARRLLDLGPDCAGRKLSQVLPPGRLLRFLSGQLNDQDEVLLVGDRVLVASRRSVIVRDREIGFVTTFRDSTELARMAPNLGVDGLTDALRALRHEFSNRLHTIAGLLELGRPDEAIDLITKTSAVHQDLSEALLERVGDPVLSALLVAKAALASERGVELRVSDDTVLDSAALDKDDLITLLGNLLDNAIDAAAGSPGAWVDVSVTRAEGDVMIRVKDSGPGIPGGNFDEIFQEGFTTKPRPGGRQRGFGLTLVRRVVERLGGEIHVRNDGGAVFTIRFALQVAASR